MNELYKKNARAQLMKDLPYHLSKTIDSVFKMKNFHYLPTLRELKVSVNIISIYLFTFSNNKMCAWNKSWQQFAQIAIMAPPPILLISLIKV